MKITNDREERREQKALLKEIYPDYDPKHHDAYVVRYNNERTASDLHEYMVNRGLKEA